MPTQILLSIKPEFSKKIFSGEKKYEFRRKIPKDNIKRVFVYESSPTKSIVGWFSIKRVLSGDPNRVWELCGKLSGIDEKIFFSYCNGNQKVYAIEIEKACKFKFPIMPEQIDIKFRPPQNFMYVENCKIISEKINILMKCKKKDR